MTKIGNRTVKAALVTLCFAQASLAGQPRAGTTADSLSLRAALLSAGGAAPAVPEAAKPEQPASFAWADEVIAGNKTLDKLIGLASLRKEDRRQRPQTIAVIGDGITVEAFRPMLALTRGGAINGFDLCAGNSLNLGPAQSRHEETIASLIAFAADFNRGQQHKILIMPLKVVADKQEFDPNFQKKIADAVDYARVNGADVISISQGISAHSSYSFLFVDGNKTKSLAYMQAAMDRATQAGILIFGAGTNDPARDHVKEPEIPANLRGVVSVANHDGALKRISGYGDNITLAFLGTGLFGWDAESGTHELGRGTSMATPLVAAYAALYRARYPQAGAEQVLRALGSAILKEPKLGPHMRGRFDPVLFLRTAPR